MRVPWRGVRPGHGGAATPPLRDRSAGRRWHLRILLETVNSPASAARRPTDGAGRCRSRPGPDRTALRPQPGGIASGRAGSRGAELRPRGGCGGPEQGRKTRTRGRAGERGYSGEDRCMRLLGTERVRGGRGWTCLRIVLNTLGCARSGSGVRDVGRCSPGDAVGMVQVALPGRSPGEKKINVAAGVPVIDHGVLGPLRRSMRTVSRRPHYRGADLMYGTETSPGSTDRDDPWCGSTICRYVAGRSSTDEYRRLEQDP